MRNSLTRPAVDTLSVDLGDILDRYGETIKKYANTCEGLGVQISHLSHALNSFKSNLHKQISSLNSNNQSILD